MRIFLDTNVVVDFLTFREPFFQPAALIMEMARLGKVEIVISALTFINVAYIARKAFGRYSVVEKLEKLTAICQISEIDSGTIRSAISMHTKDFEDCVQYLSAKAASSDLVITRDKEGFSDLPIMSMTPEDFLAACKKSGASGGG